MKIEVGKSYINASGVMMYICGYIPTSTFSYKSSGNSTYTDEGYYNIFHISKNDLICEVVPEIYQAYKEGDYDSYKDFLIALYEYHSGKKYEQN